MHAFLAARYVALTVFTICSIILSAIAAWNMSQTRVFAPTAPILQIDVYLIVVSVLGMLNIFVLVPIEIVSKSAPTSRVWFEITWVSIFWVLNLAGAAAATAAGPRDSCAPIARLDFWKDACVSSMVLQAFAWLSTVTLLAYLSALVVCTLMSASGNSRIWQSAMRDVAWFSTAQQEIKSGPSSPVLPTIREKQVPVYNIGVQPQAVLYQKYATAKDTSSDKSMSLAVPNVQRTRATGVVPSPHSQTDTPPLYPQFLQPRIQTQAVVQQEGSSPSSGQWTTPNSDSPAQQSAASSPASSTSSSPTSTSPSSSVGGLKPLALQASATPAPRPKPTGPRPKHRPPPLNLSGLSAFNTTGKRPDRAQRK
ncbi:hypothetical protein EXIGLDRAFT_772858 [Exidia glandulosa HHB12029]|uniref:MARVEL domain-containing protein n=1 Tax=Exidia glandulosa HHB12029 TaxID=1314781 RepID=A0A165F3R2_EXIGL|nr:hypothetical protein EXIGLDRAFT_706721 [Exidia glandulosa HHB12029]KZV88321.1 hypothetical protein EXIGLDRAFT_772858 [Exidia glandulosa HHB12029]